MITCWSDSLWRELLYRCGGLQGALCRMDVFVYCFTECLHSLVFFLSRVSYTYTHTQYFFFQTHTHSQCLLRCIQAWPRIGFVTLLNWDGGNRVQGVLEEAVSRLSPLRGHTTLTEWPTKQHVSVQPLPVSFIHHWTPLERGRAACVLQISPSCSHVLLLNETQI